MAEHSVHYIEGAKLVSVNVDGVPQLWDIFINGKWHGSARTIEQCKERVKCVTSETSTASTVDTKG